jgi:hypothetical protein
MNMLSLPLRNRVIIPLRQVELNRTKPFFEIPARAA